MTNLKVGDTVKVLKLKNDTSWACRNYAGKTGKVIHIGGLESSIFKEKAYCRLDIEGPLSGGLWFNEVERVNVNNSFYKEKKKSEV